MSQQFCLKWNNHTSNLLTVFKSFQSSETLVDVTLSCEGQNLKAHKVVLSACSPYFQTLFTENPCKHPIVIINGMKFTDVRAILDFMYKGEVNISHDGLQAFLKAAETLKVKGLAEVCGENKVMTQEVVQQSETVPPIPQRSDTPTKKRNRARKRSLSDSNRSDEEGVARKIREQSSPEIHELSGDESYTGDMKSNDGPTNSLPQVPGNAFSRSHMSDLGGEALSDEDYEVEPSKLLEQTLTTDSVPLNNQVNAMLSDSSLKLEKRLTGSSNMESSSLQGPDSPPDIKPIIQQFDDSAASSGAGTSDGTMVIYNEQSLSQPGPSNFQDGSVLHDGSQAQGFSRYEDTRGKVPIEILPYLKQRPELSIFESKVSRVSKSVAYHCEMCPYESTVLQHFQNHLEDHKSPKAIPCVHCGKVFKNATRLQSHLKTHEMTRNHICVYCEKKFKHISSLNTHMKTHFQFDAFICQICEKNFSSNAALKKHIATHH